MHAYLYVYACIHKFNYSKHIYHEESTLHVMSICNTSISKCIKHFCIVTHLLRSNSIYLSKKQFTLNQKKTINTEVNIYTLVCSCIFKEYCTAVYTFMLTLVFTDLRRIMYFTLITIFI